LLAFGLLLSGAPACLEPREQAARQAPQDPCTSCHGEPKRAGDVALRSAPPRDLLGASDPSYPGVGAHTLHLTASETHAAFSCSECHVVPERVDSPGHADDALPADVTFGALARTGERTPEYDPVARKCADTHCHRTADAVWSAPRSSEDACGSCHGLPPARPHPQSPRCFVCHGEVVDEAGEFVAPELHVDGLTQHAPASDCSLCHGDRASAAPPADTRGRTERAAIGVGAHRVHLEGGESSRPLACGECHRVPELTETSTHVGRLPAEVYLRGIAESAGREPVWDHEQRLCVDSWCHGPGKMRQSSSSSWVVAGTLGCDSCHGMPPPAPHPRSSDCVSCHRPVAGPGATIADRARHVDGVVDVHVDDDCRSCHGRDNPAPPRDLTGSDTTTSPGVGAHQVHVLGTQRARAVPCNECHAVPAETLDPGHVDTETPAEVVFDGVALAFGGAARYENGRCKDTSCHGGVFPDEQASGATNPAPLWTRVDGTEAACGKCHGLPPPAPHPRGALNPTCSACHENIAPDNRTFDRPDLHVDGVVTFVLP
jgi:predicted CxxxxCH...CXXCH cytochrome family protein